MEKWVRCGEEDCAVTMLEGMKQLSQKKPIEDINLSAHEIKNIRLQHILIEFYISQLGKIRQKSSKSSRMRFFLPRVVK